jgi:nitrogen permease regulator 3-like protein
VGLTCEDDAIDVACRVSKLSAAFREAFPHPLIPPLAQILATISASASKQTDNHFFASVVKSKEKELIRMYHDVVLWMLKRDMLITLHLRIRVVATVELKRRVKEQRKLKMAQKFGRINPDGRMHSDSDGDVYCSNDSNRNPSHFPALQFSRRISSNESGRSEISELNFQEDTIDWVDNPSDSVSSNSEPDEDDSGSVTHGTLQRTTLDRA